MWKKTAPLLVILSVALNAAFVGVWAVRAVAGAGVRPAEAWPGPAAGGIWCPLHRRLGVSPDQWKRIEPGLADFHKQARTVCRDVARARAEMIDLVSVPEARRQLIAAKQDEILAGQRKMQSLLIEQLLAEKRVLTPAQQAELFDLLRRRVASCERAAPMMSMGEGMGECAATCPRQLPCDGGSAE